MNIQHNITTAATTEAFSAVLSRLSWELEEDSRGRVQPVSVETGDSQGSPFAMPYDAARFLEVQALPEESEDIELTLEREAVADA